jgi:hypothetical protein
MAAGHDARARALAAALPQVIFQRTRIDYADTAQAHALLFGEIGMRCNVAQAQRMFAAMQEIRREQFGHIGNGHRAVSDTALRGDDFDQRLQPEQAARAVAHDADFYTLLFRCSRNGCCNFIGAKRERGCIAGNIKLDAHAFSPSFFISASNFFGVTWACSSVSSIWILGPMEHSPRQYTGSSVTSAPCKHLAACAASASLPLAWQASAQHTRTTCLPGWAAGVRSDHAALGARQVDSFATIRPHPARTQRMLDVVQDRQQRAFLAFVCVEDGLQLCIHGDDSNPVFANTKTTSFRLRGNDGFVIT